MRGACTRAGGGEARDLESGDALEARLAALVFDDDEGAAILVKHERHACLVALLVPSTPSLTESTVFFARSSDVYVSVTFKDHFQNLRI